MGLFDTHLHLSEEILPEPFFAEARVQGVEKFLVAGTSCKDCGYVHSLVQPAMGIYGTAGVHPHDAESFSMSQMPRFRDWLAHPGMVAVGEIGLDFYYDISPRREQEEVFATFLELAAELKKPAVIHCREAFETCYSIVRDYYPRTLPFVIHSFTGTVPEAEKWLALGAYLSYNGMVTFKNAENIRRSLAIVPLEKLLLETDSPYLAPVPHRGKANTPAFLPVTAQRIAEELRMGVEQIAQITTGNACHLFGIA